MEDKKRPFVNVEDALNYIEVHEARDDLHLFVLDESGDVQEKRGISKWIAALLHAFGLGSSKETKLMIVESAIGNLRDDFALIRDERIARSIDQLETLVEETECKMRQREKWSLDPLISELRRFRVALREDAEFKLKRLEVMLRSCEEKIEKLATVDRQWIPAHILDFLCEIEDELAMYVEEREILERGHRVYSSIIERSRAIDDEMELIKQKHLSRVPQALNWGVVLSLAEMSENGVPELQEVHEDTPFEINVAFVQQAEKKYQQLRRLYLKYHSKLRSDLKGSFDNNFAEYEGRLYFAQQVAKEQEGGGL